MQIRECPRCGVSNRDSNWDCYLCGATLSTKTRVSTDYQRAYKFDLIDLIQSDEAQQTRCAAIKELAILGDTDPDIFRFFLYLERYDQDKVVQAAAQAEINWLLQTAPYLRNISERPSIPPPLQKPPGPKMEVNPINRQAYLLAAAITFIDLLVNLILTNRFQLPNPYLCCFIPLRLVLLISLLIRHPMAHRFGLVIALVVALSSISLGLGYYEQLDAISLIIQQLAYSLALVLILAGNPSSRRLTLAALAYLILATVPLLLQSYVP